MPVILYYRWKTNKRYSSSPLTGYGYLSNVKDRHKTALLTDGARLADRS